MTSPETVIKIGKCQVAIFRNIIIKDGKEIMLPKAVLQIRYKNKQGRWAGTSSMTVTEIPKAILALQKAYEYLTTNQPNHNNYKPL